MVRVCVCERPMWRDMTKFGERDKVWWWVCSVDDTKYVPTEEEKRLWDISRTSPPRAGTTGVRDPR